MPRVLDDQTQAVCPDFEGPEWEFLRQAIVDSHSGEIPLTGKEAARLMRAWTHNNDTRVAAWNAQLEKDRAAQDKRDKLARKVKEAQEQRRVAENNKPKINSFDSSVKAWIVPRPAPYALKKIYELEYVELDYFTARRPSKNIRNDEDLSWEEMLDAKDIMFHFMTQSGLWPTAHSESLAAFFVALALHPRTFLTNGKKAILLYQSRVRREWFDSLKRNEGFNIGLINDNLVLNIANEVEDMIWKRDMDQYHRVGQAAFENSSTRSSSKRRREWEYEPVDRTPSPTPPRAEPSRKRLRSRSSWSSHSTSSRGSSEERWSHSP